MNYLEIIEPIEIDKNYSLITELYSTVFGSFDERSWKKRKSNKDFSVCAFESEGKLVAFKVGYERDGSYYSWVGGVLPEHRGEGFAKKLMEKQHLLAKKLGYKKVVTKSMNKWKSMLILNLKSGFDITRAYEDGSGEIKIVFEKSLV